MPDQLSVAVLADNSAGSDIEAYVLIVAKRAHILIKITHQGGQL